MAGEEKAGGLKNDDSDQMVDLLEKRRPWACSGRQDAHFDDELIFPSTGAWRPAGGGGGRPATAGHAAPTHPTSVG